MERSPQVRIGDWFNEAWKSIQPAWLEYVLAGVVYVLVMMIAGLCLIPVLIVGGPLTGGLYVYLAKRLLGQPAQIGDIFKGFRRFGDSTVLFLAVALIPVLVFGLLMLTYILPLLGALEPTGILATLLSIGACFLWCLSFLFLIVYPVVAQTFLVFAMPLVMFRGMKAMDAIRTSIGMVRPQFLQFLLFTLAGFLLIGAAGSVGTLLLCVGYFILAPLAMAVFYTMQLLAYRDFVGLTEQDLALYAG
ncbi:hypothetical protein HRbin11_00330 [bacterium HR11]|nr:hypothetical protein HRbin11_00330 [bacterium HR11]